MTFIPQRDVPLAPFTSLKLGGPARYFAAARERATLMAAITWAERARLALGILGDGSNLVVSDAGFSGLVVRIETRGIALRDDGKIVQLRAEAGEPWQAVVNFALQHDLAGLECLSGIPGCAGATPIQNVGAYGQEVADTLCEVEVLDRRSRSVQRLTPSACEFGYRDSRFKREPTRFIVLSVCFALRKGAPPTLSYPELAAALAGETPSLRSVAATVERLRAQKSMLRNEHDVNGRSAGSFFKNPIVSNETAERVIAFCVSRGLVRQRAEVPCFPAPGHHTKLSAAFLLERAGFQKGQTFGAVGISSKHALCLVHHGGGTTRELLALATQMQQRVETLFGIQLVQEPVLW